jgi:hypothetical protein
MAWVTSIPDRLVVSHNIRGSIRAMRSPAADDWQDVVDLIDSVMSDDALVPALMHGVRQRVREVATLPPADMAGQTRAMMAAATRAIAGRRGPTEAELSFVEDLAVTRADQGIEIEAVLAAIHAAERGVWARARELATERGLAAGRVLDARELYDDWADAVRARLIRAHREARARGRGTTDREVAVVRRLLEGGTVSALAAAEAGFAPGRPLHVLVADGDDALAVLRRVAGHRPDAWAARLEEGTVAVTTRRPVGPVPDDVVVGVAGPVPVEECGAALRLAQAAIGAGRAAGRDGLVDVADVAAAAALLERPDLAALLAARHRLAHDRLGAQAVPVAQAVRAWLLARRDTTTAARRLYVHANTVRNRVNRFEQVTGLDTGEVLDAAQAWWLCTTWLDRAAPAG